MLLVCFHEDGVVFEELLNLCEQRSLLIVVVGFDKFVPSEAVADEVGLVLFGNERGLVVDGVVAAEDRII